MRSSLKIEIYRGAIPNYWDIDNAIKLVNYLHKRTDKIGEKDNPSTLKIYLRRVEELLLILLDAREVK